MNFELSRSLYQIFGELYPLLPYYDVAHIYNIKCFLAVSTVKFQVCIGQGQLTPTKSSLQTKHTEVGTYSPLCWEPWCQKLEPQCFLAQGLADPSILLSSKMVVDSLPCLTQDWAAK